MEKQMMPPSLRELQLWMKWIVTDPRGVTNALNDPFPANRANIERYTSPSQSGLSWICELPPIDKTGRLDIYAEAYFIRIHESMKLDFPATARVLGEISFQKLVSDYLKQFPSRVSNIDEIGRNFSIFVSTYEDLKKVEFLETLIALEWLFMESFYAKDTGLLDSMKIGSLSVEDWEKAEFLIAPSVHLIETQWSLDKFWQWRDDATDLEVLDFVKFEKKQNYILLRERDNVLLESLTVPEFAILKMLQSGASLIAALEVAQVEFSGNDLETQIMNGFNSWVRRGIVYDLKIKSIKENS